MSRVDLALDIIARVSKTDRALLAPQLELVADLGLDSAKALELLVALEDRLDLEIDEDAAANLNTVGDIIAFLSAREATG
jgi:acyl carrier protein